MSLSRQHFLCCLSLNYHWPQLEQRLRLTFDPCRESEYFLSRCFSYFSLQSSPTPTPWRAAVEIVSWWLTLRLRRRSYADRDRCPCELSSLAVFRCWTCRCTVNRSRTYLWRRVGTFVTWPDKGWDWPSRSSSTWRPTRRWGWRTPSWASSSTDQCWRRAHAERETVTSTKRTKPQRPLNMWINSNKGKTRISTSQWI